MTQQNFSHKEASGGVLGSDKLLNKNWAILFKRIVTAKKLLENGMLITGTSHSYLNRRCQFLKIFEILFVVVVVVVGGGGGYVCVWVGYLENSTVPSVVPWYQQ